MGLPYPLASCSSSVQSKHLPPCTMHMHSDVARNLSSGNGRLRMLLLFVFRRACSIADTSVFVIIIVLATCFVVAAHHFPAMVFLLGSHDSTPQNIFRLVIFLRLDLILVSC